MNMVKGSVRVQVRVRVSVSARGRVRVRGDHVGRVIR